MSRYYGLNNILGVGIESTYGTAVTRTNWFEYSDFTPNEKVELYQPKNVRRKGSFRITAPIPVKHEVGMSIEGEGLYDFQGPLLEAAMGAAVSTTGAGPYVHTYLPTDAGQPAKFLTIEGGLGTSGDSVLYRGCCVDSFSLTIAPNDIVKFSADIIAQQANTEASAGSATYATGLTYINVPVDLGTITWNSINLSDDELGSITVSLSNNLQRSFSVGSLYTNIPFYSGDGRDVEVTIDVQYGSTIANAIRTGHQAGTQSDLVIPFTVGTDEYEITVRNAYPDSNSIPPVTDAGEMRYTATFRGVSDTTDPAFQIKVTNDSASGIANA